MATASPVRPPRKALSPSLHGKLRRLVLFPSHSLGIKFGIAQFLHSRRTKKALRDLKAKGFESLILGQNPEALPQDPADLMYLYEAVQNCKAQRVIEFGSGQSTVFIAQALHDLGFGHVWSLDSDEQWLEHTNGLVPAHLRPFITFVHSPVVLTSDYGVRAWRYTVVPEGEWDFVLLDGPAGTAESTMTTNLIELLPVLKPGAGGFIDHRWKTAVLTKEVLGDKIKIRYLPSLESFTVRKR